LSTERHGNCAEVPAARLECADLDEAVQHASRVPAARSGCVEVRPVIDFGVGAG